MSLGLQDLQDTQWKLGPLPAGTSSIGAVTETSLDNAATATGAAAPAHGLQVTAQDANGDARALAADTAGRLTPQPQQLVWDAAGDAVAANTNLFGTSWQPTTAGVLTITVGTVTAATAPHVVLVKTANTAPSGGSAGTRTFQLNGGATLAQGQIMQAQTVAVTPNDLYNLQFDQAVTVDVTAVFKPN